MKEFEFLANEMQHVIKQNTEYRVPRDENGKLHGGIRFEIGNFEFSDEVSKYEGGFSHGIPQGVFSKTTYVDDVALFSSKKTRVEKYDEEGRCIVLSVKDPQNNYELQLSLERSFKKRKNEPERE